MVSLCGLCFLHFFLVRDMIHSGTSPPEEVITFAMFFKNGISASVYNVIASPLLPALPERPIHKNHRAVFSETTKLYDL